MQNRVEHLGCRVTGERQPPGQQFVEHDAHGKQIAAVIDGAPKRLLGGHVGQRAEHDSALGRSAQRRGVDISLIQQQLFGESEVENLDLLARREDDVDAL